MTVCPRCSKPLRKNAFMCYFCGKKLDKDFISLPQAMNKLNAEKKCWVCQSTNIQLNENGKPYFQWIFDCIKNTHTHRAYLCKFHSIENEIRFHRFRYGDHGIYPLLDLLEKARDKNASNN